MTANSEASKRSDSSDPIAPLHVAIIMDGNGRWAQTRGLDVSEGHHAGFENLRRVVADFAKRGVSYLTLYAFSTENWDRPESEVNGILELAIAVIAHEAQQLNENGVRIKHLGRVDRISPELRDELEQAVTITASNTGLTLGIAFDYGGRAEITNAARQMIADGVSANDVDESKVAEYLYTADMPDVDLLIRTGGDFRISNFLLWQTAYSEFYSSEILWPDFFGEHIDKAFESFSERQRRFGKRA
ncbi:MAG: di-trans,poly-cis-decaprenylcistransferase [Chloroflexi bacterium]|jgi:undecaprenyl diphosphate synthase|nr:di-trans,poly-cis-decaprenylcistransferase [Chloroflexota bacterium]MBT3864304.1 di-trans,poly-cis-decaprenylcistransferase [Chloroflexota bacterium]MBT4141952.1 di-trans,poly-cis-decaprenylcistransferase [Chloroflexota bacterium]MBT4341775.1 di-trans,poly-cis-decaprenylcistransferase [Chloroflexota bacterium]MBT4943597.1 di-trans,poly-cis-decaprenylcistransferase [Chloroflexota bacterium]